MNETDFQERYEFVVGWLQRRSTHVAAAVMRLGRVCMTEQVASAAILARQDQVWLYFNPSFCRTIDNAELAGVLTHEALHFVFRHQQRVAAIQTQTDRYYFQLACEAVVNDLILSSFEELKLPGQPVTGQWLVGRDTSRLSAEQVMQLLWRERRAARDQLNTRLAGGQTIDDHSAWEPGEPAPAAEPNQGNTVSTDASATTGEWTEATSNLLATLIAQLPPSDLTFGTVASGTNRPAPPAPTCRKSMARFLQDAVSVGMSYDTLWTVPNRKLLSLYPRLILPTYECQPWRDVLVAIDTSGSVPTEFLSVAMAFARQRQPRVRITLVSFDTVCYEATANDATLRGTGGTRVQAVEDFIREKMRAYPHLVFILTDGFTPPPEPQHPERWIWLLPPWGSTCAMPKGSTAEYFEPEGLTSPSSLPM